MQNGHLQLLNINSIQRQLLWMQELMVLQEQQELTWNLVTGRSLLRAVL